jgi:hypothetical protein
MNIDYIDGDKSMHKKKSIFLFFLIEVFLFERKFLFTNSMR